MKRLIKLRIIAREYPYIGISVISRVHNVRDVLLGAAGEAVPPRSYCSRVLTKILE